MSQPLNFPIAYPGDETGGVSPAEKLFRVLLPAVTLLRLALALRLPLTGDEAYFWEWSRHPALGYYDHPPMASWVLWLSRALLGDSVLAVRGPAVLAGALVAMVIYRYTAELSGSRKTAAAAGILALGTPLLTGLGVLYSTDTPLLVAAALGGWMFHRAVAGGSRWAWAATGWYFGILILSKFLGVPIIAAAAALLLMVPEYRHHLKTPGPYLAFALVLAGTLPVLAWNATHGWATFVFNFSARHSGFSLDAGRTVHYLLGQLIFSGVAPLAMLVPAILQALRVHSRQPEYLIPAAMALFPLGGFLAISPLVEVGLHWTAVAYPFLVITTAIYTSSSGRARRTANLSVAVPWLVSLVLIGVVTALLVVPALLPGEWEFPIRPERINSRQLAKFHHDPEEIGRAVRDAADSLGPGGTFAFTSSYALSSLTAFYTPGHPQVTVLGGGSAHGRNHLLWFEPGDHQGENAVYVSYQPLKEEATFLLDRFDRYELAQDVQGVTVALCYGYNGKR